MSAPPWDSDPSVALWARHVLDEMAPMVDSSAVCVSVVPTGGESTGDVKYWVELGYMICADKPIMIVVLGDREIPEHLARVADEVVRLPDGVSFGSSEELAVRIKAFAKKYPG